MAKKVIRKPKAPRIQSRQAFLGNDTHARAHLLYQVQANRDQRQQPQHGIAIMGATDRISGNAVSVIIHAGGNDPRTHHGQENSRIVGLKI